MKQFLLTFFLCVLSISSKRTNYYTRQSQSSKVARNLRSTRPERKLVFAPYLEVSNDLSAADIGKEGIVEPPSNNGMVGPFADSPVPAYGLGGMMPTSLGLTHQPFNYMYGQPMNHPMTAMNQMNGMAMGGLQNPGAQGMPNQNMDGLNNKLPLGPAAGPNDPQDVNELDDDVKINDDYDVTRKLKLFEDPLNPSDGIITQCRDTQKQAIQISNAIMKKQNKVIYKEIMKYLLKSKYLIAMTEIKLVRVLRKKIYGLMKDYSEITEDKLDVVPIPKDEQTEDANAFDESQYADVYNEFQVSDPDLDNDPMPDIDSIRRRK